MKAPKLTKKELEERRKFKPYEGPIEYDVHIRLTKYMMTHPSYKKLSANAKVLYQYMRLWAYSNRDYKTTKMFPYSISMAMKLGLAKKTSVDCLRELESGGFIQRENNSTYTRHTTLWSFSDAWYAPRTS